ncbi:hypothetical protein [Polyangium fumosum]|uniref:Uncharacterized protein n=1 Tax=Polyangium fumosum TaxID=889272 RepID=A0A4U1JE97_9BACT|nr:hypothetical protein [Polyangium fumosum]TKD09404.1 hypothetical protein E8A74_11790 [Polyangium fumosum]
MFILLRRITPLLLLATTAACEEPPAPCHVSSVSYFARYRVLSQSGACNARIGEEVGIEVYPAGSHKGSEPSLPTIAVQSDFLGRARQEAMSFGSDLGGQRSYAIGPFMEVADADGICRAGDLAPAEITFPPQVFFDDLGMPFEVPGAHLRETWRDVRMHVTHSMPGLRFAAELTMENLTEGCKVTYEVSALSPSVGCGGLDFESPTPDDEDCSPAPDPGTGNLIGSGIDPRIPTRCDAATLHCVLVGSPLDPL